MRTLIVIPARYASSRLPGKPLADLHGKPLVQWVWERCIEVQNADVVVATDDDRIYEACHQFGAAVEMTSPAASCGTDRMAELAARPYYQQYQCFVNVQGDEPLIRPSDIETLITQLHETPDADVVTLFHALPESEAYRPEAVKAAVARTGRCLYFSRSPIPFDRDGSCRGFLKHVGIYGFRRGALDSWPGLTHGDLEQRESLEQLRLLEAGLTIYGTQVEPTGPGVDTPETLEEVRQLLAGRPAHDKSLAHIQLVATDVDGVLTDSGLIGGPLGTQSKVFHTRDGLGFRMLSAAGIHLAVISGRKDPATEQRCQELCVPARNTLLGVEDKALALQGLLAELNLPASACLFIGDDLVDLPAFSVTPHRAAPSDAHPAVLRQATLKLTSPGGHGAFREVAEAVLRAKGLGAALESGEAFQRLMAEKPVSQ